jgi:tetratricopeptide (TPR) repeat protein
MRTLAAAILLGTVGGLGHPALANELSRARAEAALRVCAQVDDMPAGTDKVEQIDRLRVGLELGEEAVEADEGDATAHFALFCNVAKQVDVSGLSWRVFGQLRRMRTEIDRTLELAPDYPEALIAKGELLRRLPGPLGGDETLALQLFRRALDIRPDYVVGRFYLARALRVRGDAAALAEARAALALATKMGTAREQRQAEDLVASFDQTAVLASRRPGAR